MNNTFAVTGTFCELEKAFDCVNHGIVVDKLEFSGITWKFAAFIQPYFRGTYQKLLIDKINAYGNISTRRKKVINWFPRRLTLGSLLLLICINDVYKITDNSAKVALFADVTSILVTISNQEGVLI